MLKQLFSIGATSITGKRELEAHRFLILLGALMGLVCTVLGLICVAFDLYLASAIPFAYSAFTLLNFIGWHFSKSFKVAKLIQLSNSLVLPFVFQLMLGGFSASGAISIWAVVAVAVAMTFEGIQTSSKWLVVLVLFIIGSGFLEPFFVAFQPEILESVSRLLFVLNFGLSASVVFGILLAFKFRLGYFIEKEKERTEALGAREKELQVAHQTVLASEEELRQSTEELRAINNNLLAREQELQMANQQLKNTSKELMENSEMLVISNENLESMQQVLQRSLKNEKESKSALENSLEELRSTQTQLMQAEKMSSLGQMTAGVAHEINNPINFVSAGVESMKTVMEDIMEFIEACKKLDSSTDATELKDKVGALAKLRQDVYLDDAVADVSNLLNDIQEGASRAAEIVRGLRNFSRIDGGEKQMADIHEGLDATLMILRSRLEGIEVIKNYDSSMSLISCYGGELNQVFTNLISNAIDAMESKGTLTITTQFGEEDVQITIIDTGQGMPQSVIDKIFDPFFTTKPIGEGTGLGLSISYGIIKKHKGNIVVESQEGEGARFVISLPLQVF